MWYLEIQWTEDEDGLGHLTEVIDHREGNPFAWWRTFNEVVIGYTTADFPPPVAIRRQLG